MSHYNAKRLKPFALVLAFVALLVLSSCEDYYQPKPRGYFRIHLPKKEYRPIEMELPYSFEIPVYSKLEYDPHPMAEDYWTTLVFSSFDA